MAPGRRQSRAAARASPLRFLSSGETRLLHNVDDVLEHFRRLGARVEEVNVDRVFSDGWEMSSWAASRRAGRHDLQSLHADRHDAAFIGLRAQESNQRRMTLYGCRTAGLPDFVYRMADGRLRICPLARWREEDVGAHILARGLPVLDAYSEEGLATRTTARLTGSAVRMGTLRRLQRNHPARYIALVTRWPELRLYASAHS